MLPSPASPAAAIAGMDARSPTSGPNAATAPTAATPTALSAGGTKDTTYSNILNWMKAVPTAVASPTTPAMAAPHGPAAPIPTPPPPIIPNSPSRLNGPLPSPLPPPPLAIPKPSWNDAKAFRPQRWKVLPSSSVGMFFIVQTMSARSKSGLISTFSLRNAALSSAFAIARYAGSTSVLSRIRSALTVLNTV